MNGVVLGVPLGMWTPVFVTALIPAVVWGVVHLRARRRAVSLATLLAARVSLLLGLGFAGLAATGTVFVLRAGIHELRDRHLYELLGTAEQLSALGPTLNAPDVARPVLALYRAAHPDVGFTYFTWPGCGGTCRVLGADPSLEPVLGRRAGAPPGTSDGLVTLAGRAYLVITSAVRDPSGVPRGALGAGVDAEHVVDQARRAAWLLAALAYALLLVAGVGAQRQVTASVADRIRRITGHVRTGVAARRAEAGTESGGRELDELAEAVGEHIDRTVTRLRAADERYRRLVEHAPDAILVDDGETVRFANAAAARLAGVGAAAELEGRPLSALLEVPGLPRTARPAGAPLREGRFRRADGRVLEVEVAEIPLDETGGDLWQTVLRDVTVRRALEDQLRQAQKMEAVGHLTGGVAHDFNNLLTIILNNAELAEDLFPAGETRPELQEIRLAARRGGALVRKLLAFSRPDKLERRPASVSTLLREVSSMLRRILPEPVRLEVGVPEEDLTVFGDAGALSQILLNLATNARDAMPDGGTLSIHADVVPVSEEQCAAAGRGRPGPHARITVRDTGVGMSEEVRDRLFEPFFTTKEPGAGTGLGLAIVYGLVRHHEGHIVVTSAPGRGTTVELLLPLHGAPPAGTAAAPEPARPCRAPRRVLVVEDEASIRRSTLRLLEREGHEVTVCADGLQALELFANGASFHLVVSDLLMPHVGGRELYERTRAGGWPGPFLFVSGYARERVGQFAEGDPAVRFLNKPWELADFLATVRELLASERTGVCP